MYLAGFVIECLLKAKIIEKHPWLGKAGNRHALSKTQSRLAALFYRHDLAGLLEALPEVMSKLKTVDQNRWGKLHLCDSLRSVASQWTIFARYSTQTATIGEAVVFIGQVEELKQWLK